LEEEVARLRRKAELEQAQRILTLNQQLENAEVSEVLFTYTMRVTMMMMMMMMM